MSQDCRIKRLSTTGVAVKPQPKVGLRAKAPRLASDFHSDRDAVQYPVFRRAFRAASTRNSPRTQASMPALGRPDQDVRVAVIAVPLQPNSHLCGWSGQDGISPSSACHTFRSSFRCDLPLSDVCLHPRNRDQQAAQIRMPSRSPRHDDGTHFWKGGKRV